MKKLRSAFLSVIAFFSMVCDKCYADVITPSIAEIVSETLIPKLLTGIGVIILVVLAVKCLKRPKKYSDDEE